MELIWKLEAYCYRVDNLLLGVAREEVRAQWELNLLKRNTLDNLLNSLGANS